MSNPSFSELFEASYDKEKFKPGAIISATVIDIQGDEVVVDAAMKSEAIIELSQFQDLNGEVSVSIGDSVEVYVETTVDIAGETRLSREKAQRIETWNRLEQAMNNGEILTGFVTNKVKGGLSLEIGKVRAFLPRSLVDVRQVPDMSVFEGEKVQVKIVKLDINRNNLVVSRRAVIEEETQAEREALLSNLNEGDVVEGIVKNLTDYGAFIDMGGTDGLLHITDMAWKRVSHPSEMLQIGDTIEVKVLKFDRERFRVSLGMKQLTEDPWQSIQEKYPPGTVIQTAKVANITDYGAFVALENAIDGLVHTSELDWTNRNIHPNKVLHVGQEVPVKVLEVDIERRRISLSIKQCQENPWEVFAHTHDRGDKVVGSIRSITDFGLFVGLNGGIDGLVHLTDLSWGKDSEKLLREYHKGQEIEALVLSIDIDRERISLGIKQLSEDVFTAYADTNNKGSIVEGRVITSDEKGYEVELAPSVVVFLRKPEVIGEINDGDTVRVAITSVDRKNRKLYVSMKNISEIEEKQAVKDYQSSARKDEKVDSTIGSLFGELDGEQPKKS